MLTWCMQEAGHTHWSTSHLAGEPHTSQPQEGTGSQQPRMKNIAFKLYLRIFYLNVQRHRATGSVSPYKLNFTAYTVNTQRYQGGGAFVLTPGVCVCVLRFTEYPFKLDILNSSTNKSVSPYIYRRGEVCLGGGGGTLCHIHIT